MNSGKVINQRPYYGPGQLTHGAFRMELMREFDSCHLCKLPFVGPIGSKVCPACHKTDAFKQWRRTKQKASQQRHYAKKRAEKAAKEGEK